MAKYSAQISRSAASTTLGVGSVEVTATTQRRVKILDFVLGSDAAPSSNTIRWEITRSSNAATGTSAVMQALDLGDNNVFASVKSNLTANGTLFSSPLLTIPLNQSATVRWVAYPGEELVIPATSGAGIHWLTPVATGTTSVVAHVVFEEL